jgi:hypothetical protein
MTPKRTIQLILSMAIVVSSLASAGSALAWGCASYITVQWGDTLSGIAALCGTTQDAIRAANPGLGSWVYAGQVLYIPTGSSYTIPRRTLRPIRLHPPVGRMQFNGARPSGSSRRALG